MATSSNSTASQIPNCALSCIEITLSNSTCTGLTDVSCLCSNMATLDVNMAPCLVANCSTIDQLHTERFTNNLCGVAVRDIGSQTRAICWSMFALTAVAVALRLISRLPTFGGRAGWDDWMILATLAVLVAITVVADRMVYWGFGQDLYMLEENQINNILLFFDIFELIYPISGMLVKISILLLYLRLFPRGSSDRLRLYCYILIVLSVGYGITFSTSQALACQPISYFWHRWNNEYQGRCFNIDAQILVSSITNIVLEVLITILPIPSVFKLRMKMRRKLTIAYLFHMGFFVTSASGIRLRHILRYFDSTNFTYDLVGICTWSIIELDSAVIVSCVPALATFFQRLTEHLRGPSTRGTSNFEPHTGTSKRAGQFLKVNEPKTGGSSTRGKISASRDQWHGFADLFTGADMDDESPEDNRARSSGRYVDSVHSEAELELMDQDPAVRVETSTIPPGSSYLGDYQEMDAYDERQQRVREVPRAHLRGDL